MKDFDAEKQIEAWLATGRVPTVEEVRRPKALSPEQLEASRSRRLCLCGHREMDHVVPSGNEARDCWPPEVRDWDLATGEEVVVDGGGCACEGFVPAPESRREERPDWSYARA